jgi:hypothetical protein
MDSGLAPSETTGGKADSSCVLHNAVLYKAIQLHLPWKLWQHAYNGVRLPIIPKLEADHDAVPENEAHASGVKHDTDNGATLPYRIRV